MARLIIGTDAGIVLLEEQGPPGQGLDGWEQVGQGLQGLPVTALAVSEDRERLFAATRGQGVWRSQDRGRSWTRIGEKIILPKVRALTVSRSGAVYAGAEPIALFRSPDGGQQWEEAPTVRQLAQEKGWKFPTTNSEAHIRSIALDPRQEETMYLAIQVGGIIRSTDGGQSWTHFTQGFDPDVHCLVVDPGHADTVYAATGTGGGYPSTPYPAPLPWGRPLYRSRNQGATWECITAALERTYAVPVRVHSQKPNLVFLGVARDIPPFWRQRPSLAEGGILRSRDGGKSWQRLSAGLPDPFLTMVEDIEFDPDNPQRVFFGTGGAGGGMLPPGHPPGLVFVSQDEGEGWRRLPFTFPSISALAFS